MREYTFEMTPENIKSVLEEIYPERALWVHKGDYGYVLVIGGSHTYSGSPIFNAVGALRAGADCVFVRGHSRAMDIAAAYTPDLITIPFPGEFNVVAAREVMNELSRYQALVIGCGLERNEETFVAIRTLVEKCDIPMVLDAEAIRAIAGHTEILKGKKVVLTPNSEEFRILTDEEVWADEEDRKKKVKTWAHKLGVIVHLKGHFDIASDGDRVLVNVAGTANMTKGGFGDVLAGITGGLLARGVEPLHAAFISAYLNGRAEELALEKFGEGVLASDILPYIPQAIREMTGR